jgi:SNF2 family DNA or RNA helicase
LEAIEICTPTTNFSKGDKSPAQRTKATSLFKDKRNIQVMVAGLKCGGVGLNLTFANRVIIV